ncbi:hypothetical protein RD110_08030 [Rhodoferax koreense]|uniref:Uncharacterized protein n=1 Tax=Rhodoferax koreensis TaxID=1842727 RepID=A0A1P8JTX7_9BURK|nr:hypothetical protein [Rhodoferax koreense]APW37151.1 hypothetical protein RD110_08030 [Rhodoferax koreense]
MSISAANVAPHFATRRSITAAQLAKLQEPAVIFEGTRRDDDGEVMFLYTVAGWLDGQNIFTMQGGATVGGDVIVIHAPDRESADLMAGMGLQDTINALNSEDDQIVDAMAAQARIAALLPIERLNLAAKPDAEKNPEFEADAAKLRILAGDDIVMAAGRVAH